MTCALGAAAEVGRQDLDARGRRELARAPDALDEVRGATVAQVVSIDRGDHHVAESHQFDRVGQVSRFVGVKRLRTTVCHIAEWATTGAQVTHDHERRRAVGETFAEIRARSFLANGMQALGA